MIWWKLDVLQKLMVGDFISNLWIVVFKERIWRHFLRIHLSLWWFGWLMDSGV